MTENVIYAPAGRQWFLASDIPNWIANLVPIPDKQPHLAKLEKRWLGNDGSWYWQDLTKDDYELLDTIFSGLPRLSKNIEESQWPKYQNALENSSNKPTWQLMETFFYPIRTAKDERREIRNAHFDTMNDMIAKGELKVWTEYGTEVRKVERGSRILIEDVRTYLKQRGIEFREIEETLPPEVSAVLPAAPLSLSSAAATNALLASQLRTEANPVRHKLRTNSLDAPIQKAITLAGNLSTAAVFLQLKNLALENEPPFTGQVEGDALCYTNDDNKSDKLTKNALDHRLRPRRKAANYRG